MTSLRGSAALLLALAAAALLLLPSVHGQDDPICGKFDEACIGCPAVENCCPGLVACPCDDTDAVNSCQCQCDDAGFRWKFIEYEPDVDDGFQAWTYEVCSCKACADSCLTVQGEPCCAGNEKGLSHMSVCVSELQLCCPACVYVLEPLTASLTGCVDKDGEPVDCCEIGPDPSCYEDNVDVFECTVLKCNMNSNDGVGDNDCHKMRVKVKGDGVVDGLTSVNTKGSQCCTATCMRGPSCAAAPEGCGGGGGCPEVSDVPASCSAPGISTSCCTSLFETPEPCECCNAYQYSSSLCDDQVGTCMVDPGTNAGNHFMANVPGGPYRPRVAADTGSDVKLCGSLGGKGCITLAGDLYNAGPPDGKKASLDLEFCPGTCCEGAGGRNPSTGPTCDCIPKDEHSSPVSPGFGPACTLCEPDPVGSCTLGLLYPELNLVPYYDMTGTVTLPIGTADADCEYSVLFRQGASAQLLQCGQAWNSKSDATGCAVWFDGMLTNAASNSVNGCAPDSFTGGDLNFDVDCPSPCPAVVPYPPDVPDQCSVPGSEKGCCDGPFEAPDECQCCNVWSHSTGCDDCAPVGEEQEHVLWIQSPPDGHSQDAYAYALKDGSSSVKLCGGAEDGCVTLKGTLGGASGSSSLDVTFCPGECCGSDATVLPCTDPASCAVKTAGACKGLVDEVVAKFYDMDGTVTLANGCVYQLTYKAGNHQLFQCGPKANDKSLALGCAAWIGGNLLNDPLTVGCSEALGNGDFNFDLDCPCWDDCKLARLLSRRGKTDVGRSGCGICEEPSARGAVARAGQ